MGECTVVLVGGNNGGKEHLLQELLGRRQGGAWCYSYRHITYDLRLLPLCALQSPALRGADCPVVMATPYSSRGVNRLLAAVDRVVHYPPVPHTLGDTHIQTVLAAAVRPGNRVRTFRRCRVWTVALCVTLWALAALLLVLLLHFGRG